MLCWNVYVCLFMSPNHKNLKELTYIHLNLHFIGIS